MKLNKYFNIKKFSTLTKSYLKSDVCIIGGGSVGLTLSHLLIKYNINHLIIEKDNQISTHPKAHYLSPKTVEILKNLNIINDISNNYLSKIDSWKYYRYCSYLIDNDSYYSEIDHFKESKLISII